MTDGAILRRWTDPATLEERFEALDVQPEQAFSMSFLKQADGEHLIIDTNARTITLDVDNGRWVWEITKVDVEADVVYGRWPD